MSRRNASGCACSPVTQVQERDVVLMLGAKMFSKGTADCRVFGPLRRNETARKTQRWLPAARLQTLATIFMTLSERPATDYVDLASVAVDGDIGRNRDESMTNGQPTQKTR